MINSLHILGAWTWLDGTPFRGFPWPYGEPNDLGGNEDCLEWGLNNNYNDRTCTVTIGYICEPKRKYKSYWRQYSLCANSLYVRNN